MKINTVGIGAYLESSSIKAASSRQIGPEKINNQPKSEVQGKTIGDKVELSYSHTELIQLLSGEEKEFLESLFGYEREIRNLNQNLKIYTRGHDVPNDKMLGTKIDLIA